MAGFLIVSLIALVFVSLQFGVNGDGSMNIWFDTYRNPGGLGHNGHCCDGKYGVCQTNGCDHKFTICLHSDIHGVELSPSECDYGLFRSTAIENQNNNEFGPVIGSLKNPISFGPFDLNSTVYLMVEVWDDDPYGFDDYVEFLKGQIRFPEVTNENFPVVLEGRTRLEATARVVCNQYYYGRLCDRHCEAPNDEDRYFCDTLTGEMICNPGWTGEACNVRGADPTTATERTATEPSRSHLDCGDWARDDAGRNGMHQLSIPGLQDFSAWCDFDRNANGWTLIQRRSGANDHQVDFDRDWQAYKDGFGDFGPRATSEYWLGLERIHKLTTLRRMALHVSMKLGSGRTKVAYYQRFWVDSEAEGYAIHLEGYSGNAGDAMAYRGLNGSRYQNGHAFSTRDRDHDTWEDGNCAEIYNSGWWFNDCAYANLNGVYRPAVDGWPRCGGSSCIFWKTLEGYQFHSLLETGMRMRPNPKYQ